MVAPLGDRLDGARNLISRLLALRRTVTTPPDAPWPPRLTPAVLAEVFGVDGGFVADPVTGRPRLLLRLPAVADRRGTREGCSPVS